MPAQPSRDVGIGMAAEQDAACRRAIERQIGADANAGLDVVLGLITSSNLVDHPIGKSADSAPSRVFPLG
jgi:hypothetical protein